MPVSPRHVVGGVRRSVERRRARHRGGGAGWGAWGGGGGGGGVGGGGGPWGGPLCSQFSGAGDQVLVGGLRHHVPRLEAGRELIVGLVRLAGDRALAGLFLVDLLGE